MKKSTIFLLVAAAVLAVVAILVLGGGGNEPPKKLDIAGYATEAELAAEKKLGMMDAKPPVKHPIDEVILERSAADGTPETIRLVREGEGDTAKWRLAAPVEALAVKYQVEQIIEVFKTSTTRKHATTIRKPDNLKTYDLEPGRRIGLTLKSKGAVWNGVDLIVGQVSKGAAKEGEGEAVDGTWVMVKGDEATAYLIAAKDLRTPADKALGDLREKKVFDFEADAVSRIEVLDPSGARVVLTGVTTETPPPPAPPDPNGAPDAKPTKSTTWTLAEPAGVKGDTGISSLARSLASLRVNEYVPLAKATSEATRTLDTAAGAKVWKVTAKVGEKELALLIGDAAKEPIWARIEGKDELMSLGTYQANSLRKGIDELKDKLVWDISADAVTGLTLKGDAGPITLAKVDGQWKFVEPAVAYPADPSSFLGTGAKLAAVRWAKASEREAAKKSLSTPEITANIKTGETVYALTIGPVLTDAEGGAQNRWAILGDTAAEPFLIADHNAKRFATKVDALRQKKLWPKGKDDIQSVSIQVAGATEVAVLEKPSTGGDLTIAAPPAGKVANDEAIRTIVSTLGALEAKSFHEGKAVAVTGLDPAKSAKVTIKGADGATATLLISATTADEGTLYALIDQGPLAGVAIAINEYQAKNLTKPLADLVKDAELPTEPPPGP